MLCFPALTFLVCCKNQKSGLSIYKVEKKDFISKITVSGIIDAKKTDAIVCPSLHSDATVVYLLPEGTHVKKGDLVCILESAEIKTRYLNAVKELENEKAEYNKAVAGLELQFLLLKSKLQLIESATSIKLLDSLQLHFISSGRKKITELELQKAALEKEKYQNKLAFLEKINESDMYKMRMKVRQCENKVSIEKAKLDMLTIRSDTEGMLIYGNLWSSGEKIREGDIVWDWMELFKIPDLSGMIIKLMVNETHYKQIEAGQKIDVNIDSHPEIKLTGKIKTKAPVGKPLKQKSKVKEYEITAALDSAGFVIASGLTVTCDVYLHSIRDTVMVPVVSVFDDDSFKVVYVAGKNKYIKRVVRTGEKSNTEIIITDGLKTGELISLGEPPLSLIKINKPNK